MGPPCLRYPVFINNLSTCTRQPHFLRPELVIFPWPTRKKLFPPLFLDTLRSYFKILPFDPTAQKRGNLATKNAFSIFKQLCSLHEKLHLNLLPPSRTPYLHFQTQIAKKKWSVKPVVTNRYFVETCRPGKFLSPYCYNKQLVLIIAVECR